MDGENLSLISRHRDVLERLGDREPSTTLEAQAVIESIRAEKGHLDEETLHELNSISDRSRQNVLRIVELKKETEAAYTRSISEQLYSSKYRLLYELVQNADDALYHKAHANNEPPYLGFTITPDTFVVETNEDGFTRANVEAICATGKSSKTASAVDDHIGEKGFGFKSVFSVADEVQIQSGVWSFYFKHRRGDDGLGMVTPLDGQFGAESQVGTRITLKLSEAARTEYQRFLDAVADVPDTTLFFLQKLKMIRINITRPNSSSSETREIRKRVRSSGRKVVLTRTTRRPTGGIATAVTEESVYHVFSHTVWRMPQDDRRRGRTWAKVELAFPVNEADKQPKLSELGQHVFAYLPLQRLPQVQFLIQSDFITSASRESVVDCAWNDAIRDGVAHAFTTAVACFAAADHPLRYSWLAYLPTRPMEHLWRPLYPSIKRMLQDMPILQTWEGRRFKSPSSLRRMTPLALHQGQPIFKDLPEEKYLAPEYDTAHETILDDLGATKINFDDMLRRLEADLLRPTSDLRTRVPSDSWHESCAALLLLSFSSQNHRSVQQRMKRLAIIPLAGGRAWTGAPGISSGGLNEIYFPSTNGVPIPRDISLHLVESAAAAYPKRKDLFRKLGVKECAKEIVFLRIEATHRSPNISIEYKPHFRYLFHFHPQPASLREWIKIPTERGYLEPTSALMYFLSNREYDTQQLLPERFRSSENDIATFVKQDLAELEPSQVRQQDRTWKEWLGLATGALYHPPLVQRAGLFGLEVSKVLSAVLEHNPRKFVGALKEHWEQYRIDAHRVRVQLGECDVPCEPAESFPLQSTYIPTAEIRSELQRLEVQDGFPLLRLPSPTENSNHQEWRFLEELGVRFRMDINFYKLILGHLMERSNTTMDRVKYVYGCVVRLTTVQDQEELRSFFGSRHSIAYFDGSNTLKWTTPSKCVWKGPDFLSVKVPLENQYGEEGYLATLFRVFLGIRDSNHGDILDELKHRRHNLTASRWSPSDAEKLYRFLDETLQAEFEWQSIRGAFNRENLVVGTGGRWYTLQSCLWRSPFSLADYQDLSTIYPNLERFFVHRLKVKNANPAMLINDIRRMAQEDAPQIDDIRQRLVEVGRMIAKGGDDVTSSTALDRLKEVKFLPKKAADGNSVLVGIDDDFVILDHKRYGDAFAQHSVLLAFALDEAQTLDKLFQCLGLTHRYLSSAVTELSTVGEDAIESEVLGEQLRSKAYTLYCCATKYKSVKALRGERELFEQLSLVQIYTTNNMTTDLVLNLGTMQVRVQSDRLAIHHELQEGQLKIYVPADQRQCKRCYKLQLPGLLAGFLGVLGEATHDISIILETNTRDLEDTKSLMDIPDVDWIERPVIELPAPLEDRSLSTPAPARRPSDIGSESSEASSAPLTPSRNVFTPESTAEQSGRASRIPFADDVRTPPVAMPPQYERLVEQVVWSAQRVSYAQGRANSNAAPARNIPPFNAPPDDDFDHERTFGNRDRNEMAHDRRIGAAGEAYVFEILSRLNLSSFSRDNWRSTIRGELRGHSRYADMADWLGRETADIVYTDRDGGLTQHLREHCFGGFPDRISEDWDFAVQPIEYFLEVKTTTSACHTRFFMSGSQFQRMQDIAVPDFGMVRQVYVIFRVFNVTSREVGMKIFVDPFRFRGRHIDFEVGTWVGKVREGV